MNTPPTEQVPPQKVPWTVRDVWIGMVVFILWFLLSAVILLVLSNLSIEINPGLQISLMELLLLVPVWWLTVRKYRTRWEDLGLRSFESQALGVGCGLMILSFMFNVFYSLFLSQFGLRTQIDLVPIFDQISSPGLLLVGGAIIAPIVEEIFFRGFIYAGLRQKYSWKTAGAISSGLFALVHFTPTALIPIFILGFIFAYLYERSNSLWPAILMHFSTNALALGAAFLAANTDLPLEIIFKLG